MHLYTWFVFSVFFVHSKRDARKLLKLWIAFSITLIIRASTLEQTDSVLCSSGNLVFFHIFYFYETSKTNNPGLSILRYS